MSRASHSLVVLISPVSSNVKSEAAILQAKEVSLDLHLGPDCQFQSIVFRGAP